MIPFTDDRIAKRLRWVMLGVMLFSMTATLSGQSQEFWTHPDRAIRFDGLSIYNATNHKFEFFLSYGWEAYVFACFAYFAVAFVFVSVLPRRPALIAIFSFILSHFYGGSNWLAVRWHFGVLGLTLYGLVLAIFVTLAAFPVSKNAGFAVRRIRWVAVGTLLLDFTNTLIGQPHTYWQHPQTVHEANTLSRMFLLRGWFAFAVYDVAYCYVIVWLASALPETPALICVFAFMFGGYAGATNWFFYEWRMGIEAPILLGIALSVVIVLAVFPTTQRAADRSRQTHRLMKEL
jgi:hypothetical protein